MFVTEDQPDRFWCFRFLQHTHSKGSGWFPSPDAVAASKKNGTGSTGMTSFTQLADYGFNTEVDMMEMAMWWEMPEPGSYGAYSADGIFQIRDDLGGAEALAEGVKKVQATGRKVQLYVSADIAHRGSSLFNESWPASRWAQWWGEDGADQMNLNGGTGAYE